MTATTSPVGSISATCLADMTVVRLRGEIDAALRPEASTALAASLERQVPVVLDAADVTFIDASGLSFVIQCGRLGHDHGLTVALAGCSARMRAMLELVGAERLFDDLGAVVGGDGPAPGARARDAGTVRPPWRCDRA